MPDHRNVQQRYPRHRARVRAARRDAWQLADAWGVPQLADDLALVVSELVTNAVVHAATGNGRQVAVTYDADATRLRVEVRDAGDGTPTPAPEACAAEAESGRGPRIVAVVADAWGCDRLVVGRVTWAEWAFTAPRLGQGQGVG